jgi:hypothetical protein
LPDRYLYFQGRRRANSAVKMESIGSPEKLIPDKIASQPKKIMLVLISSPREPQNH